MIASRLIACAVAKFIAGFALLSVTPVFAAAADTVVHVGTLIDGTGSAPRDRVTIFIRDERITAIASGFSSPAGATVIDLSTATVLPGLIDCHVHVSQSFHKGDSIRNRVTRTAYDEQIDAVNNARATLMAGFTTIRDVGAPTPVVVALKRAINGGVIPGPRLWVSGLPLGPTGGHSDRSNGLDPALSHPDWGDALIDGPDEARKAVRKRWHEGADLIKIVPSGGVMSIGNDPKIQMMADDEIRAVIDTAHALGMKVAAHAHGQAAINRASELGADSIEHGSYANAESYALLKKNGTYLVPTMLVGARGDQLARKNPADFGPFVADKMMMVSAIMMKNLREAHAAGVKIAFGSDTFGLSAHGENAEEFAILVRAGMTPLEAILAATRNAADLIGDSANVGSIQVGRYADLIAVQGNPLDDITLLERVQFVMKGGRIHKADGRPLP